MSRLRPFAVLAAGLMLAGGCSWSRARMNDPEIVRRAKAIRPGVTRAVELPGILKAQPTRKRARDGVVTYEYSYSDAKTESLILVAVNFSRTEDVTETLYVDVDAVSGVVVRVPRLQGHEPEWRCWPFGDD